MSSFGNNGSCADSSSADDGQSKTDLRYIIAGRIQHKQDPMVAPRNSVTLDTSSKKQPTMAVAATKEQVRRTCICRGWRFVMRRSCGTRLISESRPVVNTSG
mmetsp:Transcript_27246/g.52519  ORF Transcript_27246/g.52519 Transcript_27246/m.52519 type:complete len:102 (-) Transcript_27246:79-384(-)